MLVCCRGPGQPVVQHLAQISEALAKAVVNLATGKTLQIEVMIGYGISVSDPDSLESGSGSSILAESGSGSRLQKLIDSKGLKC